MPAIWTRPSAITARATVRDHPALRASKTSRRTAPKGSSPSGGTEPAANGREPTPRLKDGDPDRAHHGQLNLPEPGSRERRPDRAAVEILLGKGRDLLALQHAGLRSTSFAPRQPDVGGRLVKCRRAGH